MQDGFPSLGSIIVGVLTLIIFVLFVCLVVQGYYIQTLEAVVKSQRSPNAQHSRTQQGVPQSLGGAGR